MRYSYRIAALLCVVLAPALGGCSVGDLHTHERLERGLVLVLPGIEGRSFMNYNVARGLDEGGVKAGIEIYDWGIPAGMVINEIDYARNKRVAGEIRDRIMQYRREYPGRGVALIGHSGGGGVAVLTAELLPADTQLTCVILLAPALAPKYDLKPALEHTKFGIYNYYSHLDQMFLGVGTLMAGTVDGSHTLAAGAIGFEGDAGPGNKLHQIAWDPEMSHFGHFGDHTGWTNRTFVRRYLAPLISNLNSGGPTFAEPGLAAASR